MSLTMGIGRLAAANRNRLNADLSAAPAHLLYSHEAGKRVRGVVNGETVLDTERAVLLHETGLMPQWYVPRDDVRTDLLTRPTPARTARSRAMPPTGRSPSATGPRPMRSGPIPIRYPPCPSSPG